MTPLGFMDPAAAGPPLEVVRFDLNLRRSKLNRKKHLHLTLARYGWVP
jgi:hypothetical protein